MGKYKKEIIILSICFIMCIVSIIVIKNKFATVTDGKVKGIKAGTATIKVSSYNGKYKEAVTVPIETTTIVIPKADDYTPGDEEVGDEVDTTYPYEIAPQFEDDGSIIYDGMTLTELTNKLNKSLNGYMTNTGYFFAEYTKKTGLNP